MNFKALNICFYLDRKQPPKSFTREMTSNYHQIFLKQPLYGWRLYSDMFNTLKARKCDRMSYTHANGYSSTKAIPQLCVTLHACSQAFVEFPLGLKGLCPKGELLLTSSQLLALENVGKVFGGLPIFWRTLKLRIKALWRQEYFCWITKCAIP